MKTKNLTKPIFSLLLMLGALYWSGCLSDDSCINWTVKKELINESQSEFFPYKEPFKVTFEKFKGESKVKEITFISDGVKKEQRIVSKWSLCDSTITEEWKVNLIDENIDSREFFDVYYNNSETITFRNSFVDFDIYKQFYKKENINGHIWYDSIEINNNKYYNVIEINGPTGEVSLDSMQAFFSPNVGVIKLWIAKTNETYILK